MRPGGVPTITRWLLQRWARREGAPLPTLRSEDIMDIGFIGLGKMGFPMARRLIEAGHRLVVHDQRQEAVDKLVALGAQEASSPKEVADRVETVMASLPSLQASLEVATGTGGVIE